jgi:hypothetical protein
MTKSGITPALNFQKIAKAIHPKRPEKAETIMMATGCDSVENKVPVMPEKRKTSPKNQTGTSRYVSSHRPPASRPQTAGHRAASNAHATPEGNVASCAEILR